MRSKRFDRMLACACRQPPASVLGLAAILLTLTSCEQQPAGRPGRASVSGAITYQGKPLPGGLVTFTSAKDSTVSASCVLLPDGTYFVEDAPIGVTQISIDTKAILGGAADRYVKIPQTYALAPTSEVTYTVQEGENESADFHLE